MCGIGGWFSRDPRHTCPGTLRDLMVALKHRGPDGCATLQLDHTGLAHARLAQIDLASGGQPMWSADRRAVIVFNGEIFNYRELRARYQAQGAVFRTQSDTEVILAAYQAEGTAGFGRLRGMFAFALWDPTRRHALLVRDPLGIKPLFVQQGAAGTLLFASEVKGILALAGESPELDTAALHLLLNFRYVPGEATLFREIRQLAPGECLEWRVDGSSNSTDLDCDVNSPSGNLEQVLCDSVRAHLIADVPVGCYLSGGIDSGVMAALAHASGNDVPTFTLDVGDDQAEARNAAETARALGLRNEQAGMGDDEVRRLPHMLWHMETPKVNALQLFRLAELARTRVKTVLSGLGGDELFAGYNAHRILQAYTRLPTGVLRAVAGGLLRLMPRSVPFGEGERAFEMGAASGDWPRVYALLRNIWDRPELRRWLYGPRLLDATLPDAVQVLRSRWPQRAEPLLAMMGFEWRNKMVNDLLWQEDRASMAVGLEVRVPFVDLAVHAAAARLGTPRVGKAALREIAARYLPADVLVRPKSGFQVSAPQFFDTHLRPLAKIWLAPDHVRRFGLFNPDTVASLLRLPVQRRYRWHFFMLYFMIQSHMWVEMFERGRSPGTFQDV